MGRTFLFALAQWLCLCGAAFSQSADAVVFVHSKVDGTGFLVSKSGYILTDRHVVKDESGLAFDNLPISFKTKSHLVPAQLFECEQNLDVCLLKVSEGEVAAQSIDPVWLSCRDLKQGEPLKALGWPFGDQNERDTVDGKVTGGQGAGFAYPTTLQALPGMSGGPVYDASGAVVGVILAGVKDFPTRVFVTPLTHARTLLGKAITVPCVDRSSSLELKLKVQFSKTVQKKLPLYESNNVEANVSHRVTIAADDGFELASASFQKFTCNLCEVQSPVLNGDRSQLELSFSLPGITAFLNGELTYSERQKKKISPEPYVLTSTFSLVGTAKQQFTVPPEVPPDASLGPLLIIRGGVELGQAPLPGVTSIMDGAITIKSQKDGNVITVEVVASD
jgi:Trypsin-like peptidase domain